ncbi:MAG TPA: HD domain-containing phosphohydrolase [archaeon]|nr:HD domain-containing phosphohydrolase [archaeon]
MEETKEKIRMLVVDDDEQIRKFIRSIFEDNGWYIDLAENGPQAVEMVRKNSLDYDIALLDVIMPGPTGLDVLPELLKYGNDLAVIMLSGYAEVNSAVESIKSGAYDFLQKPVDVDILLIRVEKALEQRRIRKERRLYLVDIEKKVKERTTELEAARTATIFGLACLAEYRDEETGFHLERMAHYAVALAGKLREIGLYRDILDDEYLNLLFESAPLHDIGKVGVLDIILRKPGKLTPEEFEIMKTHTVIGARAIEDIQVKVKGQTFLSLGIEVARSHHEHFDGSGYPDGLKGNKIPLSARILSLADFYDALSFPRVYRPFGYPHEEVKEMIEQRAGSQFDPDIVQGFLECEDEFISLREKYQE